MSSLRHHITIREDCNKFCNIQYHYTKATVNKNIAGKKKHENAEIDLKFVRLVFNLYYMEHFKY